MGAVLVNYDVYEMELKKQRSEVLQELSSYPINICGKFADIAYNALVDWINHMPLGSTACSACMCDGLLDMHEISEKGCFGDAFKDFGIHGTNWMGVSGWLWCVSVQENADGTRVVQLLIGDPNSRTLYNDLYCRRFYLFEFVFALGLVNVYTFFTGASNNYDKERWFSTLVSRYANYLDVETLLPTDAFLGCAVVDILHGYDVLSKIYGLLRPNTLRDKKYDLLSLPMLLKNVKK